jgi:hypothetical protein
MEAIMSNERSTRWFVAAAIVVNVFALTACSADHTASATDGGNSGAGGGGQSGAKGAGGSAISGDGGGGASRSTGGAPGQAGMGGRTGSGGAMAANGGSGGTRQGAPDAGTSPDSGVTGVGLGSRYPGDVGIAMDPDVVWSENFEEKTLAEFFARYSDSKQEGLAFDADVPAASRGKASAKLTASGAGPNAVDFYKQLPDLEEVFVRYYARYEANVPWHHTGVWIGGYNPSSKYPNPQAGLKPSGDDRFNLSLEPLEQATSPRMDFYNYWMKMHSWMDMPMGDTAYYGNSLVHDPALRAKDAWQCVELHVKLNPDPSSGAGAELGVWVDDASVAQFTDTAPRGYWVKDKFCPESATGTECTMYRPANPTLVPLDLQYRSTAALKINAFWPQNYITDAGSGSVFYDDMVVAKSRVGCIR